MTDSPNSDTKQFVDLVQNIRSVMLTTLDHDGSIHSRPMAPQATDEDGTVWFLAFADSPKIEQLRDHAEVNLTYVDGETFVSASGNATTVDDDAKKQELWNKFAESWFQTEPTDPKVALIKVNVTGGEYWDAVAKPAQVFGMLKAVVTKEQPDVGDNEKLDLA